MPFSLLDAALTWSSRGLLDLAWWQVVVCTLVLTHLTIASVTIYLHREQTHRALTLASGTAHVFRFWLWLTTGTVTREWVAVHRKHHAKCDTPDDPHSPMSKGLRQVLLRGTELYRAEAANPETLARYGHGTPADWLERRVYTPHSLLGVAFMLLLDLLLFGAVGISVWAVQMLWIPVTAAGVINGLGHARGYRSFDTDDRSRNVLAWGILIGGEELHHNHHTYPSAARLSVRRFEFDIGWVYIRGLQALGLASVKRVPPALIRSSVARTPDTDVLDLVLQHRHILVARFGKALKREARDELHRLKRAGIDRRDLVAARRWLARRSAHVPAQVTASIANVCAAHPSIDTMLGMREQLQSLWQDASRSREQLVSDLGAWCSRAEASGIAALHEFSTGLRMARSA